MENKIQLTDEQEQAVSLITAWLSPDNKQTTFRFGGYAGTGKTTVIRALLDRLERKHKIVVSAFTGKAVSVLHRKGIFIAQTLHSLLYDVEMVDRQIVFTKKVRLDLNPDLIIVDEASMISTELHRDLCSFGKKMLFVGDPAQLEPVGDNPNLMRFTDYTLTKIHRQAAESPIITLATRVREGQSPIITNPVPGLTIKNKDLTANIMTAANQVIVAKNATRVNFNNRFRLFYKYPKNTVVEKDKLICLRNNSSFGVFNGMIFWVEKIHEETKQTYVCDLKDELGKVLPRIPIWKDPFQVELEKNAYIPKDYVYCDYGYAITCHKSQGSEWDSVLVYDEVVPSHIWSMSRWRYTSITRASKNLVYCI